MRSGYDNPILDVSDDDNHTENHTENHTVSDNATENHTEDKNNGNFCFIFC